MALLRSLGKTTVTVAGTPVQVVVPANINPPSVHACLIQALSANTGKVYVGLVGLNKSTLAQTLVVLPIPSANQLPTFSISIVHGANALTLTDLWIDADNAGEGVLISGVIA